ncbi:MAG: MauE/DoxX family redox-associated membrane protein [Phycisphaerales bacterium]
MRATIDDSGDSTPHPRHSTKLIVRAVLGAILVGAALLKAASPLGVLLSIEHLMPVGRSTSYALLSGVVVIELGLGLALLLDWRPRLVLPATTVTIVALTLVLARLAIDPWAPSCACLGELKLSEDAQTANMLGLARNGLLLAGCAYLLRTSPRQNAASTAHVESDPSLGSTS